MDEEKSDLENEAITGQISIGEEKSEAIAHKDSALKRLDISFLKHIELQEYKKTHLLSYWLKDFANYHDEEKAFNPASLKTFKRGDVIKANLGFNIGNELGGLHYCVVLDKKDNPYSGVLNVVPLSSVKENKIYHQHLCVDLGDELFLLLNEKLKKKNQEITDYVATIKPIQDNIDIGLLLRKIQHLEKMREEIARMKHGSIAYVNQITTISKQRIFRTPILSGIKLSSESLDALDKKIIELFTK